MNKVLFSSNNENWETPKELFNKLNKEYNFTLDACASEQNKLCNKYYSIENSFLNNYPKNERIFINPPYSRNIGKFIEHCFNLQSENEIIVLLLPARTDTKWFHKYILNNPYTQIEFIKGRLKFTLNGISKNSATFPSMIVYMYKYMK